MAISERNDIDMVSGEALTAYKDKLEVVALSHCHMYRSPSEGLTTISEHCQNLT